MTLPFHSRLRAACCPLVLTSALLLSACGGGADTPPAEPGASTFTLGGTVTGLAAGASITLTNGDASATVERNGTFAFPSRLAAGSGYAVGIGSQPKGQFCEVAQGSGSAGDGSATAVAVTCKTAHVYVVTTGADNRGSLYYFSTGVDGALAALPKPARFLGITPSTYRRNVVVSPDGMNAYLLDFTSQIPITAEGELGTSAVALGSATPVVGLAAAPNGKAVYVSLLYGNRLLHYPIGADGKAASTPANSLELIAGTLRDVAVTPDSAHVYVIGAPYLYHLTVAADGKPALAHRNELSASLSRLAIAPDGKTLHALDEEGMVYSFQIGTAGRLVQAGQPQHTAKGATSIALAPNGKYLYVGAGTDVYQFARGADGALSALAPARVFSGAGVASLAITADSCNLYAANTDASTVSQYTIAADGRLLALGVPAVTTDGKAAEVVVFYR
jgi:DNA-binding beta-propeller fold protein YncE